jgi:hypothetical protein
VQRRAAREELDGNEKATVFPCMRPRSLLLAFLLAAVACNGHSPTDPFGGSSAAISGLVKDSYGNVWGGVSIGMVSAEGGVAGSGLTGNDGRYSIKRLHPGHYRVWLQLGPTGQGSFVGEIDLREGNNTFDIVTH